MSIDRRVMRDRPPSEDILPDPDQGRLIDLAATEIMLGARQLSVKPIETLFDGSLWADPPAHILKRKGSI